jgi:hypothetical protein
MVMVAGPVAADISAGGPRGGGGKKDKPVPRAPVARDVTVKAVRGRTVEIALEGITGTGSAMEFSIRSQPRLGVLQPAEPVPAGNSRAVVRYTADPGSAGSRDSFTYGVQVPGRPSSISATVTVLISDARARLEVPAAMDFGVVVAGEPVTKTVSIRNVGDGEWEAEPELPEGWSWVTPEGGRFQLGVGESLVAGIRCDAEVPGELEGEVVLAGESRVRLSARVMAPFTVYPATLVLDWEAGKLSRAGKATLQNNTKQPLTVTVDGPEQFGYPATVTVAADGKSEVQVGAKGLLSEALRGNLQFVAQGHRHAMVVEAQPAPSLVRLAAESAQVVDFGKVALADAGKVVRSVILENVGGSTATVTADGLELFSVPLLDEGKGVALKAGERVELGMVPRNVGAGVHEEELTLSSGAARMLVPLRVELEAVAAAAGSAAEAALAKTSPPRENPDKVKTDAELVRIARLNIGGLLASDGTEKADVPRVDMVDYVSDDGVSVTFAWDLPPGDGWNFRILRPRVTRSKVTGQLARIWEPCGAEAVVRINGRRAVATVSGLEPGNPFKCAIQTMAADGRKSLPGMELGFLPMLPPAVPWVRYAIGLLFAVLVGMWGWKKWKEPIRAQAV